MISSPSDCNCPAGTYNPGNVHEAYCLCLTHPATSDRLKIEEERDGQLAYWIKGKKPPASPNELSPRRIKDTRNGFAKD